MTNLHEPALNSQRCLQGRAPAGQPGAADQHVDGAPVQRVAGQLPDLGSPVVAAVQLRHVQVAAGRLVCILEAPGAAPLLQFTAQLLQLVQAPGCQNEFGSLGGCVEYIKFLNFN